MALAPKFAGQRYALSGSGNATLHTIELYLDYVCPFSAKMFKTLYQSVFPKLQKAPYGQRVQFVFRQQVQPWHPSSTLVHEAAVAVLQLSPDKFWSFSDKLFEAQKDYFDVNVVNEVRNDTYKRLAKLGASVGVDEGKMTAKLKISDKPGEDGSLNTGNEVTNDFKTLIKMARLVGVHVSPTVIFNGVVENSISSSFSPEQWDEWMQNNCT